MLVGLLLVRCFRGLQNYTTLKRVYMLKDTADGFRGLQNYTTLKPA